MRAALILTALAMGCSSTTDRAGSSPGAGGDVLPSGEGEGEGVDGAEGGGEGGLDIVGEGEAEGPCPDGGARVQGECPGGEGEGEGEGEASTNPEVDELCDDTCAPAGGRPGTWAGDGSCDDGGPGADTPECSLGTDCADCGVRQRRTPPDDGGDEGWDGPVLCEDTCGPAGAPDAWAGDGACDDGGPGAEFAECDLGTDCTDCGPRGCNREHPCEGGLICREGACVIDDGGVLNVDIPDCGHVPTWQCEGGERFCGEIVPFEPDRGDGWWDYPLNGETDRDQYRSYVRRDVMMLVKYATASVACLAATWDHGNHQPLGLGDMSESNGDIPGTREGQPGHPAGTHVNGHDMDIAYYQVGTRDNTLRSVCDHVQGGADAYHCVGEPTLLDPWRTALFLAKMHDSPQLRVVGVDGKVGPMVEDAIASLCANGWLDGSRACRAASLALAYEVTDTQRGWFHFHHHHLHISLVGQQSKRGGGHSGRDACIVPGCPP